MLNKITLSGIFLFHVIILTAQSCFTDQAVNNLMQRDQQYAREIVQMRNNPPSQNGSVRAVRTVSVVVHVVYNTSAENVSQSVIDDMITVMNEDFRAQNTDISNVRSQFQSDIADVQIEFCLDQVKRVQYNYNCFDPNTQADDMKSVSPSVDPTSYLNIWIVDICGTQFGGVAGYAYLPTTGMHGSSIDGVVLDYDIGLGTRSATHEVGHYFGLEHIFAGCGTHANNCSDLPEQSAASTSCTAGATSCGSLDQWENFMDYTFCRYMFTSCQASYMNAILSNTRSSLLSSPGCSNNTTGPSADFSANPTSGCPGLMVSFSDQSSGNPTSWSWSFPGGSPSSSNAQNPTVTYNSPGTYNVTLTVSNSNGNDAETKNAYITILSASSLPLVEGFQSATFPPTGWKIVNSNNDGTWSRSTSAGGYGQSSASAAFNNYDNDERGHLDFLVTPVYDFSGVTTARVKFDYAYARYDNDFNDSLIVAYSLDCGDTYYLLWKDGNSGLATAADQSSAFVPNGNEWATDSIDLSNLAGQAAVQLAFVNKSGWGNWLYLDNINIYAVTNNPAPVANFTGAPLTIPVGGTVNFTDLSTNNPAVWNWSFPGSVQGNSSQQHPSGIRYNTVGTYDVSLTVSNSFGSNTSTKTDYVTVVDTTSSPGGCDTISNLTASSSLTIFSSQSGGYVSGHNSFGDIAKADKFIGVTTGATVDGALLLFGVAQFSSGASTIAVRVWDADGSGGAPNTVLASENVTISSIATDISDTNFTYVSFSNPPTITGDFFVGIEFTYAAGDTVALVTTADGDVVPTTAWEKWSDNSWHTYNDGTQNTWQLDVAHVIFPIACTSGTAPTPGFSANLTSICEGESVTFSDQSGGSPASWDWSFPGGTPSTSTQQNPTVVYNTAGTYDVTLQVTNGNGANSTTTSNYIAVSDAPAGTISVTNVTCNGGNNGAITLSVSGGATPYGFSWSNGANSQNINNLTSGTYTVTITDANGCSSTAGRSVGQPSALTIAINATEADCGVANAIATANPSGGTAPYSYNWSNGQTSSTISGLNAGNYMLTVTDAHNCTVSQSVTIQNSGGLTVTLAGSNITCNGQNDGSVVATANGGSPAYSYNWSNGDSTATISNLSPGNYTLTLTDAVGCEVIQTVSISQPSPLQASATSTDATCGQANGTASANVSGGVPNYNYSWSNGQTGNTISGLTANTYTVTVTDDNGCQATASATVNATAAPNIVLNAVDVSCNGTNDGSISANVNGGASPYSYSWSNGQTGSSISNLAAGQYSLTVTDNNNCTASANVMVNETGPNVTVNKTDVQGCNGDNTGSISLTTSGGQPPYSFTWSNGQGGSSLFGLTAGNYVVTVTDNSSCSVVRSVDITEPTGLSVTVQTTSATSGGNDGSASVTVSGGTTPYSYLWNNGQTGSSISNVAAGNYTLTVTDNNGCMVVETVLVDIIGGIAGVKGLSVLDIYPNPNQGMFNMDLVLSEIDDVTIDIFNIVGKRIYSRTIKQATKEHLTVDISQFNSGTYYIRLNSSGFNHVEKVVKTN